jgi:hypothetical protein
VSEKALRGMANMEMAKITPLSSGSDYLLPTKFS